MFIYICAMRPIVILKCISVMSRYVGLFNFHKQTFQTFPPSPPLEELKIVVVLTALLLRYVRGPETIVVSRAPWLVCRIVEMRRLCQGALCRNIPLSHPTPTSFTLGRNLHSACFYWFRGSLTPYSGHANKISHSACVSFPVNTITGTRVPHTI